MSLGSNIAVNADAQKAGYTRCLSAGYRGR